MPVTSVWQNNKGWIRHNVIKLLFFLLRNLGILIGKTLSLCWLQKHKHMPKEFQGNNLGSWFKLEASCIKRGRPHTTFPWSLQGIYQGTPADAIPLKLGVLGQLAVEECYILALHLYLMPLKSQLCNSSLPVLQNEWRTSETVNRSLCGTGFSCLVYLSSVSSFFFIFFSKWGFFEVHLFLTKTPKCIL